MQLANQEAQRFNHEYIGTEHILLGLVKEGSGVAANVLKNLDIDLRKIRLEVEKIVQHGPGGEQVVMGRLPHTPRTKRLVECAIEEARTLNHNYVGTEHLLLGALRVPEGVACQILVNLGLTLEDVREEVLHLLGTCGQKPSAPARETMTYSDAIAVRNAKITGATTIGELEYVTRLSPDALRALRVNLLAAVASIDALLAVGDVPHVRGEEKADQDT